MWVKEQWFVVWMWRLLCSALLIVLGKKGRYCLAAVFSFGIICLRSTLCKCVRGACTGIHQHCQCLLCTAASGTRQFFFYRVKLEGSIFCFRDLVCPRKINTVPLAPALQPKTRDHLRRKSLTCITLYHLLFIQTKQLIV